MADLYLHCSWELTRSVAACQSLSKELQGLVRKSRDEKLASLEARMSLARLQNSRFPRDEYCTELRGILQEHPDYAEAKYFLSSCVRGWRETAAVLEQALELEPDNYHALSFLLVYIHGADGKRHIDLGVDADKLATYRKALYQAAKARVKWELSIAPPDSGSSDRIWWHLFQAARYMYFAAERSGDREAMAAVHSSVHRDAGFDALDYSAPGSCPETETKCDRGSGEDNLRLACQPMLTDIGLDGICTSAVEQIANEAASKGLELPTNVLTKVDFIVPRLRQLACGIHAPIRAECLGWHATETEAIARLRSVLSNYGGPWSSEHHRVYAQGFLGDEGRIDRLRIALKVNPKNERARCNLVRALAARGRTDEAKDVLGDDDPMCLKNVSLGFTWVDQNDALANEETSMNRSRQ